MTDRQESYLGMFLARSQKHFRRLIAQDNGWFRLPESRTLKILCGWFLFAVLGMVIQVFRSEPESLSERFDNFFRSLILPSSIGAVWSEFAFLSFIATMTALVFVATVLVPKLHSRSRAKLALNVYLGLTIFVIWFEPYFVAVSSIEEGVKFGLTEGLSHVAEKATKTNPVVRMFFGFFPTIIWCLACVVARNRIDREIPEAPVRLIVEPSGLASADAAPLVHFEEARPSSLSEECVTRKVSRRLRSCSNRRRTRRTGFRSRRFARQRGIGSSGAAIAHGRRSTFKQG